MPNYHIFNGSQGKLDASGFCVANALYDPLFVMSANGKVALPFLALSATPNHNYTVWTIALRQGVNFTNGDPFNADIVVANYTAANADPTVGLAIKPIIASVTKVDSYTVQYNMVIPFSAFPISLAEQQIACLLYTSEGRHEGRRVRHVGNLLLGQADREGRERNHHCLLYTSDEPDRGVTDPVRLIGVTVLPRRKRRQRECDDDR